MILINMKMPESCGVCKMHFLGDPDYICCQITDRIPKIVGKFHNSRINLDARKASIESVARPDWCPLIEVSEHGRLIDADKLGLTDFEIVMCDGSYKKVLEMLAKKIEDAPTVIPADKDINVPTKTNADHIRSMTDEELAKFIYEQADCFCQARFGDCIRDEEHCRKAWLKWLKEEVQNERISLGI